MTFTTAEQLGGLNVEVTIPADGRDEEIARAFFARVDLQAKINDAVVEYDERVVSNHPYEDAVSLEELARSVGR